MGPGRVVQILRPGTPSYLFGPNLLASEKLAALTSVTATSTTGDHRVGIIGFTRRRMTFADNHFGISGHKIGSR
jgi:hypothetical protein